jgi:hypothetical protein
VEKLLAFSKIVFENASTTGRSQGITVYVLEDILLKNLPTFKPVLIFPY